SRNPNFAPANLGNVGFQGMGGFGGGQFGQQGGGQFIQNGTANTLQFNNRYQGQQAVNPMGNAPMAQQPANANQPPPPQQQLLLRNGDNNFDGTSNSKLTFEQLQERQKKQQEVKDKQMDDAKKVGTAITALDPHQSIAAAAAAEDIGDAFRYVIEER